MLQIVDTVHPYLDVMSRNKNKPVQNLTASRLRWDVQLCCLSFIGAVFSAAPSDHGLLLQMGHCSGLQQSCFHPLQYYRRGYLIPNNQLIRCPWRRGHLCSGNFIPVPRRSLPFPLLAPVFSLCSCASTVSTDKQALFI